MPERDYGHRDVLDKLGIKTGFVVFVDDPAGLVDPHLRERIGERAAEFADDVPIDVVLTSVVSHSEAAAALGRWRPRIRANGAIWLLTPKRGQPGYVNQTDLISIGLAANVVDNKVCSFSDGVTAMRFVIRRVDRLPD